MRTTHITLLLYHQLVVNQEPLNNVRCGHCGKLLAKVSGRIMTMANIRAPEPYELPIGIPMFEVKCSGCNTTHSVVWQ